MRLQTLSNDTVAIPFLAVVLGIALYLPLADG